MSRPRAFDEAAVVEQAMVAFWTGGYGRTSTERLCEATGLGRGSIYNAFTDKRELFRRALRRYGDVTAKQRGEILNGPGSARERVGRLLELVLEQELADGQRGCLAVNTVVELGDKDPEIGQQLRDDFDRFIADVAAVIDQGQREGELRTDQDPLSLATYLHTMLGGLRVAARAGRDRAFLAATVAIALTAF